MVQDIKTYRYRISITTNVIKTEHFSYSFSPFVFFLNYPHLTKHNHAQTFIIHTEGIIQKRNSYK